VKDDLRHLKERVYQANLRLQELGLVIATFGNASTVDRVRGVVAIKPSGVSYDMLAPENMVLLDLEGRVLAEAAAGGAALNPSSDTKTHLRLYREFPEIGGVVHTHSKYATAWAQARRALPCLGTTHADVFHGEVPCTAVMRDDQIRRDYEEETAVQILETFARLDYRTLPGVLVACHGPFTWGRTVELAVYHSQMLEAVAEINAVTLALSPHRRGIKRTLLDKHFQRKHGKDAYYGQKEGKE